MYAYYFFRIEHEYFSEICLVATTYAQEMNTNEKNRVLIRVFGFVINF